MNAELRDLRQQIANLPDGNARQELCHELIRRADATGDTVEMFEARVEMTRTATFSGYMEHALVSFSWCLSRCDTEPQKFPESRMFWSYKWVLCNVAAFPQIPLSRIRALQDDARARYIRHGLSLRVLYLNDISIARAIGRKDLIRDLLDKSLTLERDYNSDCMACEPSSYLLDWSAIGEDEKALEAAKPVLSGRLTCTTQPQNAYTNSLLPLLRVGRFQEAVLNQRRSYPKVKNKRGCFYSVAMHIEFQTLIGEFTKAIKIMDDHLPMLLDLPINSTRYFFNLCCLKLMSHVATQGRKQLSLVSAHLLPIPSQEGKVSKQDLLTWFDQEVRKIAALFDKRNGNDYYTLEIATTLALPI